MRRRTAFVGIVLALALVAGAGRPPAAARAGLPARLTDAEFWRIVDDFSEPNGFFRSDNLVSNENTFQTVIPRLQATVKPGAAYLGVGPDQNFTYIAALRPAIAFITDIRRGNLQELLMYKALVQLSADRAEFLSRLFARPRPPGLSADSTPSELFAAYSLVPASQALYENTLEAITNLLERQRGTPLSREDKAGIAYVYGAFFAAGPGLSYSSSGFGRGPRYPTYEDLQTADDGEGGNRAYLGSEASYKLLKSFEDRNLIVPLVGDFAGSKALRAVASYLKDHGAVVGAFYTSNVEQYLFQDGIWKDFAANIEALPLGPDSTFIRSCFNSCSSPYGSRSVVLLDSMAGLMKDFAEGKIQGYWDVLSHSR